LIRLQGEAWFHCKMQALAKEQRFGVEDRLYPSNRHGMGVRRSPLSFRLRRIRAGMRNYGANLRVILNRDKLLRGQYLRTRKPWVAGGFAGSNFMPCEIFPPCRVLPCQRLGTCRQLERVHCMPCGKIARLAGLMTQAALTKLSLNKPVFAFVAER
jgi:hypothetical protein